jgi:hypothetical protein
MKHTIDERFQNNEKTRTSLIAIANRAQAEEKGERSAQYGLDGVLHLL